MVDRSLVLGKEEIQSPVLLVWILLLIKGSWMIVHVAKRNAISFLLLSISYSTAYAFALRWLFQWH